MVLRLEGFSELPRRLRPRLHDPAVGARFGDVLYSYLAGAAREGARSMSRCSARPSGRQHSASPYGAWRGARRGDRPGAPPISGIEGRIIIICIRHLGPGGRSPWRPWWPSRIAMSWASAWAATKRSSRRSTSGRPIDWPTSMASVHRPCGRGNGAGKRMGGDPRSAGDPDRPRRALGRRSPRCWPSSPAAASSFEVCPGSNVALGLYPDRASIRCIRLIDAGVASPSIPTIRRSSHHARHRYDLAGLDEAALGTSRGRRVEASFADEATRQKLLRR